MFRYGKPSSKEFLDIYPNHLGTDVFIKYDIERTHRKFILANGYHDESYNSKEINKLGSESPLKIINTYYSLLKNFLRRHSGLKREYLQDYLNLFVLIINKTHNLLEKVEFVLNRSLSSPVSLKYRNFYSKKWDFKLFFI